MQKPQIISKEVGEMKHFYRASLLFSASMILGGTILLGNVKADDTKELAQAAQNPVAKMVSLPFQNNTNFGVGPDDDTQNILNIQPVVPFELNDNWNVITRTILPVIYQPEIVEGTGSEFGLGDINETIFLSPANPGKFIWGLGPVFSFPTATDDVLGTDKWSAGLSGLGLTIKGPWVIGALVSNLWSYAGDDDRGDVNSFLLQYFVNYNMADGWYLTSSPVITADWEADSDNQWTVPFGGGFGKIFKIGKQPINAQMAAYYNVETPDNGPDWSLRLQLQFLFPK
jgi:hypothetical protein